MRRSSAVLRWNSIVACGFGVCLTILFGGCENSNYAGSRSSEASLTETEDRRAGAVESEAEAGEQDVASLGAESQEVEAPLETPAPVGQAVLQEHVPAEAADEAAADAELAAATSQSAAPDEVAEESQDSGSTATTAAEDVEIGEGSNQLAEASSRYLLESAESPIHWLPWGEEAFARARKLDRPVLIDIGASWCHWCQVMDTDTYGDEEVIAMLNENFVAVKVDRDERPDIDERYQMAHFIINRSGGGWPLTAFALPDGRVFESLTYVPPVTEGSRVGMRDILQQVIEVYRDRRGEVVQQAEQIEKGLETGSSGLASHGAVDKKIIDKIFDGIAEVYDVDNAGFGSAAGPKFPNGSVLAFLLDYHSDHNEKKALDMVSNSLVEYFRGGLRDHVLGGYFRYSVDGKFRQPHFEKVLYVQSDLLSAYARAYAAGRKSILKEAGEEIIKFCQDSLENRGGGFYASQDADIGPGDDGSYYTWTREEIEEIAGKGRDADVFMRYHNVDEPGFVLENGRSVLAADELLAKVAGESKISYNQAQKALDTVRDKLHAARMSQERVPYVDKSIIASWNAQMVVAYLDAYRHFGSAHARDFALETCDFILENMVSSELGAAHVYAKGQASQYGLLDDQVQLAAALIEAHEVSARAAYLETAESLMEFVEKNFLDEKSGLYRDRISGESDPGLLRVPRFQVFDNPTAAPNAVAAMVWHRLGEITSRPEYRDRSVRLVESIAGQEKMEALAAGTYGRAAALVINGRSKSVALKP